MNMIKIERTSRKDYKYNAQVWTSIDGKNWHYTGNGKFCKNGKEIEKIVKEYNAINDMCINCAKLSNECGGTTCQTWTGCVYRTTL